MPQGCKNAATFFARIVQEVFRDAYRSIQKYHKNILGLLHAHQQIFDSLRRYNLVDPSRVEAITNANDTMKTKDQVHTFIRIMRYNRGYIPQLALRITPLHDLLREGHSMDEWKDEVHGKIVRDVKKLLTLRPLLKLPDPRKNTTSMLTRASKRAAHLEPPYRRNTQ
jgi:hypothetical protein